MSYASNYGGYGKSRRDREFHEKAWLRKKLPDWDAKWHALSAPARLSFVSEVKGPMLNQFRTTQPSVPADKFSPEVLKELTVAGFVEVRSPKRSKDPERVFAADGTYDFATRVRALRRYHLLAGDQESEFLKYLGYCYYTYELAAALNGVLRKASIDSALSPDETAERYVVNRRWPGWVAASLSEPLAEKVLNVVQKSSGPVSIAELPAKIPGSDPKKVRAALDSLVAYLVLFEDLNPKSQEIVVGLLPAVREAIADASKPRACPPLVVVESPHEVGPDGSLVVNDLRGYLFEVASEPPRLRQDGMLFQKEVERFLDILEPVPEWLMKVLKWTGEGRLNLAHNWALSLALVKQKVEGKEIRLVASPKGKTWLSGSLAEQYHGMYEFLRAPAQRNEQYTPYRSFLFPTVDSFSSYGVGDSRFLAANMMALKHKKGSPPSPYYYDVKPEDHQTLRAAVLRALDKLPPGVFHTAESVYAHLSFGSNNPLNLGSDMKEVSVFAGGRAVPPLEEERELAARRFLDALVSVRLIPMGCLQVARDAKGLLCLARTPRLDAYFGRAGAKIEFGGASAGETRVVVQPDFSVIIIGLNPAPAADFAPFCVRTTKTVASGAIVLKLTRDSVVKAIGHGLKASEIVERLQRHASNEIPANVLHEVKEWCGWVRQVSPAVVTVLRCGDRATADRAAGALGKQAERLGETMVALPQGKLTSIERGKLQSQGIIVSAAAAAPVKKVKLKKKAVRRRAYYDDDFDDDDDDDDF